MDEMICVQINGQIYTILTQFDPKKYGKCIRYERGIPVIYTKVKNSLYGTLQANLLFWKDLIGTLEYWVFDMNPYSKCVANKNNDR